MATSKNLFDQFDAPAKANIFDAFDGQTEEASSARYAADSALALGQGGVQGTQMLTNVAGADNKASRTLGSTAQKLASMESPYRRAEKQNRARLVDEAEKSGSLLKEIGANLGGFAEAPLDTTLNALGTSLPTLGVAALTGGGSVAAQLGARFLPGLMGGAQGVGAVKGAIYDTVSNKPLPGETPEQAEARAVAAQSYNGENLPQIALGGGLGVLAGSTGIESAANRLMGKAAARTAGREATEATTMDLAKAAGVGALKESPIEGIQGGQERVASNIALQNEGFDTPTFEGAIGQGVLEATASAPLGGGFGVAERLGQNPGAPAPAVQPPAPNSAVPADLPPFVNPPSLSGSNPASLLGGQGGGLMGNTDPLRAVVKPSEAMGIDPSAGPLSRVAAAAVDSGVTDQTAMDEARAAAIQEEPADPAKEAPADPDAPMLAAIESYNEDMQGMASPSMVSSRFGITVERAAQLLAKIEANPTPQVDDLFPRPAEVPQAAEPAEVSAKAGEYTVADAIGPDGPVSEKVRLVVRPDGSSVIIRENDDVIDVTNMVRAGFTAERAIAQSIGDDTTGRKVSSSTSKQPPNVQDPAPAPQPEAAAPEAPAVEAPAPAGGDGAATAGVPDAGRADAAAPAVAPATENAAGEIPEKTRTTAAPTGITKADLDKVLVPDMTDAQLRAGLTLYGAVTRRANTIRKEIQKRGLDAKSPAPLSQEPSNETKQEADARPNVPDEARQEADEEGVLSREPTPAQTLETAEEGRPEAATLLPDPVVDEAPASVSAPASESPVTAAANEAATSPANNLPEPTAAQKEAGNYKKGHVQFDGLDLTIENPVGSTRTGTDGDGNPWSVEMTAHYGYHKRTKGADGDQLDVYLAADPKANVPVFVVDQYNDDGSFDESKAVAGVATEAEAIAIYDAHFSDGSGPRRRKAVTSMSVEQFKQWATSDRALAPAANDKDSFVPAPDGGFDYGEITPAMSKAMRRQAGKIRLQRGNDKFGLMHIEMRHGEEIRAAGFPSVEAFVADIAQGIGEVWQPDATSQLVAIKKSGNDRVMFVQLTAEKDSAGDFYTVRTAFPSRADYVRNKKKWKMLWEGRAQPSQPATSGQAPFAVPPQDAGEAATIPSGQSVASVVDQPALTQSEAAAFMTWQDMGTEGGVKRHILTFYRSKADADEKRGRMTVATITKGDVSSAKWAIDGSADSTFAMLPAAKRAAEAKAMEQAIADGFVTADTTPEVKSEPAAKPKKQNAVAQRAAEAQAARADFFTPGNIVRGYGGIDEVLAYETTEGGAFAVTVHEVTKVGDQWHRVGKPQNARRHSTQPDARELAAGPIERLGYTPAAQVVYTSPRADGQPFPNAVDRGVAPAAADPVQADVPADQGVIQNFGESLPPARRAMAAKLDEDLTDDQIATQPLSQIWPLTENDAIEDTFAAAVAHAARAEIPAKPRVSGKVRRWVERVKSLRTLAGMLVSGRLTRERMESDIAGPRAGLKDWYAKVLLLEQLPREQWKRVGAVGERPDAITYKDGQPVPLPTLQITIDDKPKYLRGDGTVAGNLDAIKELLGTAAPEKRMEFEIRGRASGPFKINKKGDSQYRTLMEFATVDEARKATREQYDALVNSWEVVKARDNITERDLRSDENRERAGKDWREGKDVTPEQFQTQFGFRGGEFGKWVQQGKGDKERQAMLNSAYDALMDLSQIVGVPPRAISLNGTLGIAFGSRGSGWASAHFEPSNLVINLTKTRGAGALAHEWFHALDNYFSRQRGGEVPFKGDQGAYRRDNFITHKPEAMYVHRTRVSSPTSLARLQEARKNSPSNDYYKAENWVKDPKHPEGVRPEVERVFAELVQRLNESPMAKRAALLDGVKTESSSGYWSQTLERAARSFENFVQAKMLEQGYHNDFLANVRALEDTGRSPERYPYLLPGEVGPIADAFTDLFDTIQTKTDDAGNVTMFERTGEVDRAAPSADTPADANTDTSTAAARNIGVLERAIARNSDGTRDAGQVRPYDARLLPGDAELQEIAETFGSRLQGFGLRPGLLKSDADRFGFFNGVRTGGTVFIAAKGNTRPHLAILGHELGHELRTRRPDLYDRLVEAIRPYVDQKKYEAEFLNSAVAKNAGNKDKQREEFIGEVLSDGFMDRDFWRALGNKNPSLLRQIGGLLMNLVEKVLKNVGYTRKTEQYLTDYKAVMTIAGEVMAEFGVKRGALGVTAFNAKDAEQNDTAFNVKDAASRSIAGVMNNVREASLPAGYVVNDFMQSSGKVSWWAKTVGTMYDLSQRQPLFRPVFEAAQKFLSDVSFYATQAADMAPTILPKLETLKDITKSPLAAKDSKAIAAPIFEGTLVWGRDPVTRKPIKMEELEARAAQLTPDQKAQEMIRQRTLDPKVMRMWQGLPEEQYNANIESRYASQMLKSGIVFTPAELKELFGLDDKQVGLYQEFRNATDKSLTDMAVADMVRFGGKDLAPVADVVLGAKTLEDAAKVARDYLVSLAEADPDRSKVLTDSASRILDKAASARDLMDRGYAPLSRFGKYSVDVVDKDGERLYFGLFESQSEANKMVRQMRDNYPDATIASGTMSAESYKVFAGVTPETLELFGEMLGLESTGDEAKDKAFQEYLKLAKNQRSAMKRLIHRKGIAGFSEDPGRVLAGFIYSNSRQISTSLNLGNLKASLQEIPKGEGELADVAAKLTDYVSNPIEEAQAIRGLLFAQYLGGSVASALLNALQPVQVTFPWLSQYGGPVRAASRMNRAIKDVLTKAKLEDGLAAAIKKAEEQGIVSPQEVFQLQAQAAGRASLSGGDGTRMGDATAAANNALSRLSLAWGKLFGAAEQFNRRTTFIAAYRTAQEQRINDPAKFAERAVNETQFMYCVDSETECLTTSGWKRRDQLSVGDVMIGVDADGAAIETPLKAVHRFDGRREVTEYSNATRFSMVVTDGHRHFIQNYNSRDKKWQKPMMPTTAELRDGHHLVRAPLQAIKREGGIGVDMAALLGWIAAEGNYAKFRGCRARNNVRLVQSIHHNPEYVAEIDALLERLGGHHKKFIAKAGEMATYTLKRPLSDAVRALMPEKLLTWEMTKAMSAEEMLSLIDAFAKGDGHKVKEGGWIIAQKQEQNLEVLHAMAAMVGQNATLYPAEDRENGRVAHLYLHSNTKRTMVKQLTKVDRVVEDGVWCPETESGTWIARRNGAMFVTGNSKANKPQWARGAIGATVFTFKQYSISYVELMQRMYSRGGPEGKRAALLGIGVLVLMSGVGGLPFIEDLDDVVDGFMQRVMNRNFSSKQAREEFFIDLLGEGGAAVMTRGFSGLPGAPVDVSGRLGLGNLLPGTGIFQKKEDYGRDLLEIVGPAGDFGKRILEAAAKTAQGEVFGQRGALMTISPVAARNLGIAYDMATTGSYNDKTGKKVIDTTPSEAAFKAIGFQPASVDKVQDATRQEQIMKSLNQIREKEIADKWARGVYLQDQELVQDARAELAQWNEDNPESPMRINLRQISERVKTMRMTKAERLAKTAPKELRAGIRERLERAE